MSNSTRMSLVLDDTDKTHVNRVIAAGLQRGVHLNDSQAARFALRHIDLSEATKENFAEMKTRRSRGN